METASPQLEELAGQKIGSSISIEEEPAISSTNTLPGLPGVPDGDPTIAVLPLTDTLVPNPSTSAPSTNVMLDGQSPLPSLSTIPTCPFSGAPATMRVPSSFIETERPNLKPGWFPVHCFCTSHGIVPPTNSNRYTAPRPSSKRGSLTTAKDPLVETDTAKPKSSDPCGVSKKLSRVGSGVVTFVASEQFDPTVFSAMTKQV
mmetsp:Transcript_7702/g.47649  ORF Transcript_7702/g.47649 Transcript_7702/m.47649 type:complete len:202 (+) Transcript_7702:6207-6812(+)